MRRFPQWSAAATLGVCIVVLGSSNGYLLSYAQESVGAVRATVIVPENSELTTAEDDIDGCRDVKEEVSLALSSWVQGNDEMFIESSYERIREKAVSFIPVSDYILSFLAASMGKENVCEDTCKMVEETAGCNRSYLQKVEKCMNFGSSLSCDVKYECTAECVPGKPAHEFPEVVEKALEKPSWLGEVKDTVKHFSKTVGVVKEKEEISFPHLDISEEDVQEQEEVIREEEIGEVIEEGDDYTPRDIDTGGQPIELSRGVHDVAPLKASVADNTDVHAYQDDSDQNSQEHPCATCESALGGKPTFGDRGVGEYTESCWLCQDFLDGYNDWMMNLSPGDELDCAICGEYLYKNPERAGEWQLPAACSACDELAQEQIDIQREFERRERERLEQERLENERRERERLEQKRLEEERKKREEIKDNAELTDAEFFSCRNCFDFWDSREVLKNVFGRNEIIDDCHKCPPFVDQFEGLKKDVEDSGICQICDASLDKTDNQARLSVDCQLCTPGTDNNDDNGNSPDTQSGDNNDVPTDDQGGRNAERSDGGPSDTCGMCAIVLQDIIKNPNTDRYSIKELTDACLSCNEFDGKFGDELHRNPEYTRVCLTCQEYWRTADQHSSIVYNPPAECRECEELMRGAYEGNQGEGNQGDNDSDGTTDGDRRPDGGVHYCDECENGLKVNFELPKGDFFMPDICYYCDKYKDTQDPDSLWCRNDLDKIIESHQRNPNYSLSFNEECRKQFAFYEEGARKMESDGQGDQDDLGDRDPRCIDCESDLPKLISYAKEYPSMSLLFNAECQDVCPHYRLEAEKLLEAGKPDLVCRVCSDELNEIESTMVKGETSSIRYSQVCSEFCTFYITRWNYLLSTYGDGNGDHDDNVEAACKECNDYWNRNTGTIEIYDNVPEACEICYRNGYGGNNGYYGY